jgi:tRNA(fMet)-specific endonuclease VapC
MNGSYLLDTNVLIAILAADAPVRAKLLPRDELYVPVIAIAELYNGAMHSLKTAENVQQVDELVVGSVILGCDLGTAREYGALKSALRAGGTPIPDNDLWIAAIAKQHDLTVLSRDRHFEEVPGLRVERW